MKTRSSKLLIPFLAIYFLVWGCATGQSVAVCGNGECESGETVSSCSEDCKEGVCGNGVCDSGETADNCSEDCQSQLLCGNSVIDSGEHCEGEDVQGVSCADLNAGEGTVTCNNECHFDLSGCSGGCIDQCIVDGMSRCSGNQIQRCQDDGSGCMFWVETGDCETSDTICDDSLGGAACSATCNDACTSGVYRCLGNITQFCETGANGCLQWRDQADCSLIGQMCSFEDPNAICVDPCSNSCDNLNDTMCIDEVIQVCGTGSLGCNEWQAGADCAETGKLCSQGICACATICNSTDTQCSEDTIQTCVANTNGCLEFVDGTDCTLAGEVCNESSGTAICAETCSNACTMGQTQCLGTIIQDCQTLANGCLGWVSGVNCSSTGEICSGGSCQCDNECSSGDSSCDGILGINECAQDGNGCWEWVGGEDCLSQGLFCVSFFGVVSCQ
jgi:hypothetical protein